MATSAFNRLAARADKFASHAAFATACAVVAQQHGIPASRLVMTGKDAEDLSRVARGSPVRDGGHRIIAWQKTPEALEAERILAARRAAIYLTVTFFCRGQRSVARAIGVHNEAVRKAVSRVEDERDDPSVERTLDECEVALMGA